MNNACGLILAHNHPSGCLDPSDTDKETTKDIVACLDYFNVYVLDHMIVAHGNVFSFAENGLL